MLGRRVCTAIFVWIDGFSFSALIGSRILGKIPRISIESGKNFAEDFSFWMGFLLVKTIFLIIFLWDPIVQNEIRQSKRKPLYSRAHVFGPLSLFVGKR